MLELVKNYGATVAVAVIVAAAAALVAAKLVRDGKKGKCTGCSNCPMHGQCEKEKKE